MQASRVIGSETTACIHIGGAKETSNQQAKATAGTQVKQMTKNAGPSAGSAKE